MMTSDPIVKRFLLENELGLHMRPISHIVRTLKPLKVEVVIKSDKNEADGKSVMSMMMLEALPNDELEFHFQGEDAQQALEAVEALFRDNFGE